MHPWSPALTALMLTIFAIVLIVNQRRKALATGKPISRVIIALAVIAIVFGLSAAVAALLP